MVSLCVQAGTVMFCISQFSKKDQNPKQIFEVFFLGQLIEQRAVVKKMHTYTTCLVVASGLHPTHASLVIEYSPLLFQ